MAKIKKSNRNLVVSMNSDLKESVVEILDELGLNQSQVVTAFFKQIARTRRVPLSFDLNDSTREPDPIEKQAIESYISSPNIASKDEVKSLEEEIGIKLSY